ncbi:MAG: hypothetical protein ACI4M9_05045, partial [Succinivibrio sp.]
PEFNTLVFTQSDESDLDFINNLCSDFGINYSIEFNEESNKNKVVFSRGYITGTQFADKSLTVKLNPASPSFFDEHTLEDIVSSGDMFNAEKTDDKQQDYTYAFNFLLNDTDSEKNRKDIVEFCQKSKKALKENLCDKTIIRANDLNYAPGAILSVPDYDDKSNYTVARAHLKLYSLGEDPAKSEYSLLQTVLCVNGKNPDILGAVNRIPRISLESRPSDIEITPSSSAKTNERSSSTGDNGTVFCVGTVCDESGDSTSTSDKTYVPAKGGDGSVPTKFYLKVDDNDKPVIVHYLNSKAGTSDYLSDFPKLGQKVVAIKTGGSYLFYAYLPGGNSLDVIPLSVRNYQINAKTIYEQANSAGHAVDQDINNQGISVTQFDSMKDRIFATILQGSIDSFIDACVFRFNDLELYNRYTTTVKVKLSDNSEVSCSDGVKKLLPKLKDSRNAYLLEKEKQNSADLENKKKALSNVYSDLYAVSEKIVEIVGKDKLEDNKPIAVTDITSSGDTDIKANKNVTISGDTITLKAKTIKLEADGPKGVSIDADYSLALNTVSSSIELNPRKIDMGVKRCYIADLPYDSSLSIGQGISLSAVNVKIDSLLSASMSDGFGASVKAAKGKASMSGMDLSVKTISSS